MEYGDEVQVVDKDAFRAKQFDFDEKQLQERSAECVRLLQEPDCILVRKMALVRCEYNQDDQQLIQKELWQESTKKNENNKTTNTKTSEKTYNFHIIETVRRAPCYAKIRRKLYKSKPSDTILYWKSNDNKN